MHFLGASENERQYLLTFERGVPQNKLKKVKISSADYDVLDLVWKKFGRYT